MNELRKCGSMYIKFDEQGNPEYGFEVEGRYIKKLHLLCDKPLDTFMLPDFGKQRFDVDNDYLEDYAKKFASKQEISRFELDGFESIMEDCFKGSARVCGDCFSKVRNLKNVKLIAPTKYSIMLDWGAFESGTKVTVVLPNDMDLFQVYRSFSGLARHENEHWTLIGQSGLKHFYKKQIGDYRDCHMVMPYDSRDTYVKYTAVHENDRLGENAENS